MRSVVAVLMTLLSVLGLSFAVSGTANAVDYKKLVVKHSQMCAAPVNGSVSHLDPVFQYHCGGAFSYEQQWTLNSLGHDLYTIQNRKSGMCIEVDRGLTQAGAYVVQAHCDPARAPHQRWYLRHIGAPGEYLIHASHSGHCLDVAWSDTRPGAKIVQSDCERGNNQIWTFANI